MHELSPTFKKIKTLFDAAFFFLIQLHCNDKSKFSIVMRKNMTDSCKQMFFFVSI